MTTNQASSQVVHIDNGSTVNESGLQSGPQNPVINQAGRDSGQSRNAAPSRQDSDFQNMVARGFANVANSLGQARGQNQQIIVQNQNTPGQIITSSNQANTNPRQIVTGSNVEAQAKNAMRQFDEQQRQRGNRNWPGNNA